MIIIFSKPNNIAHIQEIQGKLREAKNQLLLNEENNIEMLNNKLLPLTKPKISPLSPEKNFELINPEELLNKQKKNSQELMKQQKEIDNLQQIYKEMSKEQNSNINDL